MKAANRVNEIQEYYFSRKLKEVAKLNAEGQDIISLAIETDDRKALRGSAKARCTWLPTHDGHTRTA